MRGVNDVLVLGSVVLLFSIATAAAAAAAGGVSAESQAAVLQQHNQYRKQHRAPPLAWSTDLEEGAAAQAASCTFKVDSSNPYGVNIYATSSTDHGRALVSAVDFWYDQAALYNFSAPGYQQAADSFTQVVWASSSKLGCAAALCLAEQQGISGIEWGSRAAGGTLVVCWYSPAGNTADDATAAFAQNVKPLTAVAAAAADVPPRRQHGKQPSNHTAAAAKPQSSAAGRRAKPPKPAKPSNQLYPRVIHPAGMNAVYQRLVQKIRGSGNNGASVAASNRANNTTTAHSSSSSGGGGGGDGGSGGSGSNTTSSTAFWDAVDAPEVALPAGDFHTSSARPLPRQLSPKDTLTSPECLQSANKLYKLCLHDSGNLVLYQSQGNGRQAVWSSNTAYKSALKPFTLRFESQSPVLIVRDAKGDAVWKSRLLAGTLAAFKNNGYSYRAVLNSNGNLVVMDSDRRAVWSTKTGRAQQNVRHIRQL